MLDIEIKILDNKFYVPTSATPGSAGFDLVATKDYMIGQGEITAIHTGIALHIADPGIVGVITPRSGLGTKGLVLANTVGVIDSDYQGEIIVNVWNRNPHDQWFRKNIELKAGDRFAQLLFIPVVKTQWHVVNEFTSKTTRGDGGFGSTDK